MPKLSFLFKKTTGFTLIELMITMTVIAVVSAVGFATYRNSQIVARDGKRKQDLRAISSALEVYRQLNGRYPCNEFTTSLAAQPWIKDFLSATYQNAICNNSKPALDSNYINILPVDPLNVTPYYYRYRGFDCVQDGKQYYLSVPLENTNDPDRISAKNQKNCNGVDMYPTYIAEPNAFVIIGQ